MYLASGRNTICLCGSVSEMAITHSSRRIARVGLGVQVDNGGRVRQVGGAAEHAKMNGHVAHAHTHPLFSKKYDFIQKSMISYIKV